MRGPTTQSYAVYEKLAGQADQQLSALRVLIDGDLAQLNAQLGELGVEHHRRLIAPSVRTAEAVIGRRRAAMSLPVLILAVTSAVGASAPPYTDELCAGSPRCSLA